MSDRGSPAVTARPRHRTYFFLSYAHSAPTSDAARTDTDAWVGQLFSDLSAEVAQRARPVPGMEVGFFDQHIPLGADWKAELAGALGAAEVFVPLYSPGYFGRPWALGEQESFRSRLAASRVPRAAEHVVPVLWIPVPSWDGRPDLHAALDLGDGIPEYAENGLRALCMLATYREQYARVLDRLAHRIVTVAEHAPLGPSRAPGLDELGPASVDSDTAFAVAVLAPTVDDPPPGRAADRYADHSTRWRPFADRQALPVAEYAASTAERLGLPTRIVDLTDADELLRRCPAVVLIDPWTVTRPGGAEQLRAAAARFPDWVVPLVISDGEDTAQAARGVALADTVLDMLHDAGIRRARQVRRVLEFVEIMPVLVTQARRQFLKHAPVFPPVGPPIERARLSHPYPSPRGEKTDD